MIWKETAMPVLKIIVLIIIVGVLLWLVHRFIPMDATVRLILNIVVIGALIIWILKVTGILSWLFTMEV